MDLRGNGGSHGGTSSTDWLVSGNDKPQANTADNPYGTEKTEEIKVVLLGAPGVGKTAIAQQFVWGTFESSYFPTSKKETYYPSVVHHDRKYHLKVVDTPDVPFLPVNSFYNLSDLKAFGLRDANAYVLVFDLLCPDSFEYVSGMYSQINESRDLGKVPVVVVGNKTDKVNDNIYKSRLKNRRDSDERRDLWERESAHNGGHHGFGGGGHGHGDENGFGGGGFGGGAHGHGGHDHGFGHFGGGGGGFGSHHHDYFGSSKKKHKDKKDRHNRLGGGDSHSDRRSDHHRGGRNKHSKHSYDSVLNWSSTYTPDEFLDKDIADKVTSEWKVIYKECSAKDPEAVTDLFKSVMGVFEEVGVHTLEEDEEKKMKFHDYDRPKPCVIL